MQTAWDSAMSQTHQSCDRLVSNHLDMAIDQLILHLHILISLFWQMNGDVLCSRAGCYRIIILRPLFVCHCDCAAFPLARPTRPTGSTVCLLEDREIDGAIHKGRNEGRGNAAKGDWEKRDFIHWLVIHYRTGCRGRQWTDIKGPKEARGSDTAGSDERWLY